jgi:DNA-binding transcriptional regulator YdaS (Cro superfamily)
MMSAPVEITKQQAVEMFGTQANLARALGIAKSAVSQWADGPIPELQAMKIRFVLKPHLFGRVA